MGQAMEFNSEIDEGSGASIPSVCAICKRDQPDYTHPCGADFHRTCLEQYFRFAGSEERVCPHCLKPITQKRDQEAEQYVEPSDAKELLAQQYLDLSERYHLELINDDMYHLRVYITNMDLETGIWHMYPVVINYANYPNRPRLLIPDDLLTNALDLTDAIEMLRRWDPKNPPTILELIQSLEASVTDRNILYREVEALTADGGKPEDLKSVSFQAPTYGNKVMRFSLDLSRYPGPPSVVISDIPFEMGLESIRNWMKRESKLGDVVREVRRVLTNHYRKEFEIDVLSMYFDVEATHSHVLLRVTEFPVSKDMVEFEIRFPEGYPIDPPLIDLKRYEGLSTKTVEKVIRSLEEELKRWSPTMYVADVLTKVASTVFERSPHRCAVCRESDCPKCGLLLEDCRDDCPNCHHPLHRHCMEGLENCPYCMASLMEEVFVVMPTEE